MAGLMEEHKHSLLQERRCRDFDLSPCPRADGGEIWTKYPVVWPNVTEGAEQDHPPLLPVEIMLPASPAQPNEQSQQLDSQAKLSMEGSTETV